MRIVFFNIVWMREYTGNLDATYTSQFGGEYVQKTEMNTRSSILHLFILLMKMSSIVWNFTKKNRIMVAL